MLTIYLIGCCVSALLMTFMLSRTTYYNVFKRQCEDAIEDTEFDNLNWDVDQTCLIYSKIIVTAGMSWFGVCVAVISYLRFGCRMERRR